MTGPTVQLTLAQLGASGGDGLLPILVVVPLLVALALWLMRDGSLARTIAVGGALGTLLIAGFELWRVCQTGQSRGWAAPSEIFGLDSVFYRVTFGLSMLGDAPALWLVVLSALLIPAAMLATPRGIDRASSYYAWLLVLLAMLAGAFLARDLILFYAFFELTLVPSFFLIAGWGGAERRYAATKFFVFTFAGSLFMLASIICLVARANSSDITMCVITAQSMSPRAQLWIALGFLAGFGVKVPLLPLHTWLPTTYTAAGAPITALLTGALAKLGTYGLLRIAVPAGLIRLDGATQSSLAAWVVGLSVVGILYAALVAWTQRDAKRLLAYSSISHLGFCALAIAGLTTLGGQAGLLYMINHGLSAAGLFLLIGMIEDRTGTRSLDQLSGLGRERPWLASLFVLFTMSSIGLPGTGGFVSEFLSILSTRAAGMTIVTTILAASGIVLGAIYMLFLVGKLIFGPAKQPEDRAGPRVESDLDGRELLAVVPLAVAVLVLGVMPNLVLESTKPAIARIYTPGQPTLAETPAPAAPAASVAIAR